MTPGVFAPGGAGSPGERVNLPIGYCHVEYFRATFRSVAHSSAHSVQRFLRVDE